MHGLFVATNVALMAGASMILQPKFEPAAGGFPQPMARATSLMGIPTFYTRLLAHPGLTREAVAGMRLFISGSALLPAQTHRDDGPRRIRQADSRALRHDRDRNEHLNPLRPRAGSLPALVGFPAAGRAPTHRRRKATGAEVDDGEIGVIEVKGPNVCAGYWRNPEKTAEAFRQDGFFVTGDLGQRDARGYVSIVGRGKDLIITGGLNVYPKEVEAEIDALPGVVESAVIGLPHADFGEGVTAVVAVGPHASASELTEGQGRPMWRPSSAPAWPVSRQPGGCCS